MKTPIMFVIVYQAPGPYSEFLSEFSEFISALFLKRDKVIIVGDFNIHVDIKNDSLGTAFLCAKSGFIRSLSSNI